MSYFSVLAMRPISLLSPEERDNWGNEKLDKLLEHYGAEQTHSWEGGSTTSAPKIDPLEARGEWMAAKQTALSQDYPRQNIRDLWVCLATHYADQYPNLIKLAAFAITCPAQTADCERGFSAQNRILTALRNRLKPETVHKLMSVKLGVVDLDQALEFWAAEKPRRLFQ